MIIEINKSVQAEINVNCDRYVSSNCKERKSEIPGLTVLALKYNATIEF